MQCLKLKAILPMQRLLQELPPEQRPLHLQEVPEENQEAKTPGQEEEH